MAHKILIVTASANQANATSRSLAQQALELIGDHYKQLEITERDTSSGIPAIDDKWIAASYSGASSDSETQARLQLSDQFIEEIRRADEIIIATPMYNFSLPAGLKSWIDHITRAGVTFRYTEEGPIGLLDNKPVTLIVTTGGVPADSNIDFLTPYLRHVLGFIGLKNISLIAADAMNVDPVSNLNKAQGELKRHIQKRSVAA